MAVLKQFDKKLTDLWHRRIVNVESLVRKRAGRPKSFTKKARDKGIKALVNLADEIVTKEGAKEELAAVTSYQRRRQIKGRGLVARSERILKWARSKCSGAIIYSFWRKKRCLYVGKGNSWKRLKSYQKSVYLKDATLLKVRGVTSRSHIGKAECLAKHLCEPRDNKIKPATKKWGKVCPVCKAKQQIRTELRSLFRLK